MSMNSQSKSQVLAIIAMSTVRVWRRLKPIAGWFAARRFLAELMISGMCSPSLFAPLGLDPRAHDGRI